MERLKPRHPPGSTETSSDIRETTGNHADCFSCRLTGAGCLTATAIYLFYQTRNSLPVKRNTRIFSRVFATGLLGLAVARLFTLPPFSRRHTDSATR
ncbi:hypothetical protein BV898_03916 [Hypsibius exemplaris]|uniref:Distal membrane-arm assembly complex protein 1-like domain-containing protein n=1 Tax=Hypsibius exemplaris TaxID=2072580 RepID=A0A1W0X3U0_HYPEX|nr:hypothetical protein BV898_03916 [Hypsibius exemplaris]